MSNPKITVMPSVLRGNRLMSASVQVASTSTGGLYSVCTGKPSPYTELISFPRLLKAEVFAAALAIAIGETEISIPDTTEENRIAYRTITVEAVLGRHATHPLSADLAGRTLRAIRELRPAPRLGGPYELGWEEFAPNAVRPIKHLARMRNPRVEQTSTGEWLAGYFDVNDRQLELRPSKELALEWMNVRHARMWEELAHELAQHGSLQSGPSFTGYVKPYKVVGEYDGPAVTHLGGSTTVHSTHTVRATPEKVAGYANVKVPITAEQLAALNKGSDRTYSTTSKSEQKQESAQPLADLPGVTVANLEGVTKTRFEIPPSEAASNTCAAPDAGKPPLRLKPIDWVSVATNASAPSYNPLNLRIIATPTEAIFEHAQSTVDGMNDAQQWCARRLAGYLAMRITQLEKELADTMSYFELGGE